MKNSYFIKDESFNDEFLHGWTHLEGRARGPWSFLKNSNRDPSLIVFSEIKRCQHPHSTQFFQEAKNRTWKRSVLELVGTIPRQRRLRSKLAQPTRAAKVCVGNFGKLCNLILSGFPFGARTDGGDGCHSGVSTGCNGDSGQAAENLRVPAELLGLTSLSSRFQQHTSIMTYN